MFPPSCSLLGEVTGSGGSQGVHVCWRKDQLYWGSVKDLAAYPSEKSTITVNLQRTQKFSFYLS